METEKKESASVIEVDDTICLTEDGKTTCCGVAVGKLVPYDAFSNAPCKKCVKKRMDSEE